MGNSYTYQYNVILAECPPTFQVYEGRCYGYNYAFQSFEEARRTCAKINDRYSDYDLVSIHSSRENEFIRKLNSNKDGWQAWIGLSKYDRQDWPNNNGESILNWTDGTNITFQNWGGDEPSNIDEDGVSILFIYIETICFISELFQC